MLESLPQLALGGENAFVGDLDLSVVLAHANSPSLQPLHLAPADSASGTEGRGREGVAGAIVPSGSETEQGRILRVSHLPDIHP